MFKKIIQYYKSLNRLYLLFFFTGIFTGLLFYFYSEDKYEQNLFKALAGNVKKSTYLKSSNNGDTAILVNSLHFVHSMISAGREAFQDNQINGFKAGFVDPLTVDLMTGNGACGSYSMVMTRLLKELGRDVRLVQMKVDGYYGGHIILEAKEKNDWIVFDPLYNLYFKRPDGKLASFNDVEANWNYYRHQVPSGYDQKYRYEGKRYTNWKKIPVLMPGLKKILDWTIGKKEADTFSLRVFTLRKFQVFFAVTLMLQVLIIIYMLLYTMKKRKTSILPIQMKEDDFIEEDKNGTLVLVKPKTLIPTKSDQ